MDERRKMAWNILTQSAPLWRCNAGGQTVATPDSPRNKKEWRFEKMTTTEKMKKALDEEKTRSAWGRGVKEYAAELISELDEAIRGGWFDPADIGAPLMLKKQLLNGAIDWQQYSWSGCSLIYNEDIAARLCSSSELKRTKNGKRRPNAREEWLDTQARALGQAARMVQRIARECLAEA